MNGFLLIALDSPDVFPAGDLALRRAVRRLYGLDHLPMESELLGIAERVESKLRPTGEGVEEPARGALAR